MATKMFFFCRFVSQNVRFVCQLEGKMLFTWMLLKTGSWNFVWGFVFCIQYKACLVFNYVGYDLSVIERTMWITWILLKIDCWNFKFYFIILVRRSICNALKGIQVPLKTWLLQKIYDWSSYHWTFTLQLTLSICL